MNLDLNHLLTKAQNSKFHLWLLNFGLLKKVPFNSKHNIRIIEINDESIKVVLPYQRSNLNHIKGIHACALATLCEYTCGLMLTRNFDEKNYRLIMRSLEMKYEKQARQDVFCTFGLDQNFLQTKIIQPLLKDGEVFHVFDVEVRNDLEELICTAKVEWQLKSWDQVRTK